MAKSITNKLNRYIRNLGKRVELALVDTGNKLMDLSKPKVPTDTYALLDSRRVNKYGKGLQTIVCAGYGHKSIGESTFYSPKEGKFVKRRPADYAVFVHQNPELHHDTGEYLFLSRAIYGNEEQLAFHFYYSMELSSGTIKSF